MTSHVLASPLMDALVRNDYQQKFIAGESKTPRATFSDHVTGKKAVTIQKAKEYVDAIKDSRLNYEAASLFFGTVPVMTGDKYQQNPLALEILQERESRERKELKTSVREALTLSDGNLYLEDRNIIMNYTLEYIDEIVVEVTLLASFAELLGVTVEELIQNRMTYLQTLGFMRKGN